MIRDMIEKIYVLNLLFFSVLYENNDEQYFHCHVR